MDEPKRTELDDITKNSMATLDVKEVADIVADVESSMQDKKGEKGEKDEKEQQPLSSIMLIDKLMGMMVGCAIGEAYGKYLCSNPDKVDINSLKDLEWGYSTDQLLAVIKTVAETGQMHVNTFLQHMISYSSNLSKYGHGHVDEYTQEVLEDKKILLDPAKVSNDVYLKYGKLEYEYSEGKLDDKPLTTADNSPLIRAVVMGLFEQWDAHAFAACMPTHADHRCISACTVIAGATHSMFSGRKTILAEIVTHTAAMVLSTGKMKNGRDVDEFVRFTSEGYCTNWDLLALGTKYTKHVYKCMSQAMVALGTIVDAKRVDRHKDGNPTSHMKFKWALEQIAKRGGDVAANCALSGALMGCELGMEDMPSDLADMIKDSHKSELMLDIVDFLSGLGLASKKEKTDKPDEEDADADADADADEDEDADADEDEEDEEEEDEDEDEDEEADEEGNDADEDEGSE